jgi:hypothetical protein
MYSNPAVDELLDIGEPELFFEKPSCHELWPRYYAGFQAYAADDEDLSQEFV